MLSADLLLTEKPCFCLRLLKDRLRARGIHDHLRLCKRALRHDQIPDKLQHLFFLHFVLQKNRRRHAALLPEKT